MKGVLIQICAAVIVSMSSLLAGFGVAWPSYTIPTLQSNSTPLGVPITLYESSLIGSCAMMGSCVATVFGAYISDTLGRKKSYVISLLCHTLSWSLVSTARTVTQIVIGRLVLGVGMSLQIIVGLVYTSEFCQLSLCGPLISLVTSFYTIGVLLSYISGWMCSYEVINYAVLTTTVISLILTTFLKESPAFLVLQGKDKEALSSLKFYRGASETTKEILEELTHLKRQKDGLLDKDNTTNEEENLTNDSKYNAPEISAWKVLYTSTPIRRALITSLLFVSLMVSCGTVAINVYAGKLFRTAVPDLSPDVCSVMLAVAVVIGSILAVVITDLVTRRVLMLTTTLMSMLCLLLLASLLRWRWAGQWSIPAVVLVYCCIFQIGTANIIFVQFSETFPSKVKSQVNTIISFFMWAVNFIVVALYEPSVSYLGVEGTITAYAVAAAVLTFTAALLMKETRRVPMEDILEMYSKGFFYKNNKLGR